MSRNQKIFIFLFGGLWFLAFFKGNFMHDKPNAVSDIALLSDAKIFRNLRFGITQKEKLSNGSYRLVVSSTYRGQPAGFQILLGPSWKKLPGGSQGRVIYHGKVTYFSLGEVSDRFLEMLNDYYLTNLPAQPMVPQISFTALISEGDPEALDKSPVKLELVFDGGKDSSRAEFINHIDFGGDLFYFMEKSIDYRKPILLALREK